MDLAAAAALVRAHWKIEATITTLPGTADANYRVRAAEGDFALKLAASSTRIDFECDVLQRLSAAGLRIATPRVVPTADGKRWVDVGGIARLVTFLPGELLSEAPPPTPALLRDLGAQLAEVDVALSGLDAPPRVFEWDLAQADWMHKHLDAIKDVERRELVESVLRTFSETIQPTLAELPRAVIHNDANDQNLLVDGDGICGLFDFGDAMKTCRVFEPAIAATYAAFRVGAGAIGEIRDGYHGVTRLGATERTVFVELVRVRAAISAMMAARNRDSGHQSQAWSLLAMLENAPDRRLRTT